MATKRHSEEDETLPIHKKHRGEDEYVEMPIIKINRQIGVVKPNFQLYVYNYNLLVIEERYNILTFIGGNVAMMNAR